MKTRPARHNGTSSHLELRGLRTTILSALLVWAATLPAQQPAAPPATPPAEGPRVLVYRNIDGQALHAYVFDTHAGQRAQSAILLFHGGGWSDGSPEWMFASAQRFAGAGMVAIPIEYRLATGTTTPIESLSDVCSAFQWARTHATELHINPRRVAGYGVSAGGHLLASTVTVGCPSTMRRPSPRPDALLLLSPALDAGHDAWFGRKLQGRATAADYSPLDHITAATPPTSIVEGEADTLTPAAGVKQYCERIQRKGAQCELTLFPRLGHLLTRKLDDQESGDYDPDPEARAAGNEKQLEFLGLLGFIKR